MKHTEFQQLKPGDRIRVQRYEIKGRKPCIDEETGEPGTRPVARKAGTDVGVITSRFDAENVNVLFDAPVPDINDPARTSDRWMVYFRDVVGRA